MKNNINYIISVFEKLVIEGIEENNIVDLRIVVKALYVNEKIVLEERLKGK